MSKKYLNKLSNEHYHINLPEELLDLCLTKREFKVGFTSTCKHSAVCPYFDITLGYKYYFDVGDRFTFNRSDGNSFTVKADNLIEIENCFNVVIDIAIYNKVNKMIYKIISLRLCAQGIYSFERTSGNILVPIELYTKHVKENK